MNIVYADAKQCPSSPPPALRKVMQVCQTMFLMPPSGGLNVCVCGEGEILDSTFLSQSSTGGSVQFYSCTHVCWFVVGLSVVVKYTRVGWFIRITAFPTTVWYLFFQQLQILFMACYFHCSSTAFVTTQKSHHGYPPPPPPPPPPHFPSVC